MKMFLKIMTLINLNSCDKSNYFITNNMQITSSKIITMLHTRRKKKNNYQSKYFVDDHTRNYSEKQTFLTTYFICRVSFRVSQTVNFSCQF